MSVPNSTAEIWKRDDWIQQTQRLLNSYVHWIGTELIQRSDPHGDACALFHASFVVVSHGTEADPLLNYANASALQLWKMTPTEFLGTPSRMTAEPVHRTERAELLRRTTEQGFIDDYSGTRTAANGDRFQIHRATVWNLIDDEGAPAGQAATFSAWTPLTSPR